MDTIDPLVLAYCGGIFDGEGYITIRRWVNKRKPERYTRLRHELQIGVNQVRPEAIMTFYEAFGSRVWFQDRHYKATKHYSGRWAWDADSAKAVECLQALLPYLRIKKPEADIAIAFQATKMQHGTGRAFKLGITPEERAFRESCYSELKRLKRVHYDPAIVQHYIQMYTEYQLSRIDQCNRRRG